MLNWLKKSRVLFSVSHIFKKINLKTRKLHPVNNILQNVHSCNITEEMHVLYWSLQLSRQGLTRCKLPALQQFGVNGLLSAQRSLFALAGRLALEGDAFLHRWMAEGVGTAAELHAVFRVIVGESGRGTWRGVTRRFLILLRRRDRCQRTCKNLFHGSFTFMTFSISLYLQRGFHGDTDWNITSEGVALWQAKHLHILISYTGQKHCYK